MIHCKGCGTENPGKASFCRHCGQPVRDPEKNAALSSISQSLQGRLGYTEGMSNARKGNPSTPPPPPSARKKPRNAPGNKPSTPPPPPPAGSDSEETILSILKVAVFIGVIIAIIALAINGGPNWLIVGCCMGSGSLAKAFWGD